MASRKLKIADQCSRCPREQERYVSLEEAVALSKQQAGAGKPAVEILMDGEKVASYDFLCDNCKSTVTNYIGSATRPMEKKSSKRGPRKAKKKEAPPVK